MNEYNNENENTSSNTNLISKEKISPPQNPGTELKPIKNSNSPENANQVIIANQLSPLNIHCIPISAINSWGSIPHTLICPFCNQNVTTLVEASCNMGSCCLCFWLSCITWAIILLCMGKEIGCADATHKCPNCKNVIGVYRSC